ncbi:MAG: 6-phosphogluconolactonase [Bacteroidota bacterium]
MSETKHIDADPQAVAKAFADWLVDYLPANQPFHMALSGGSTPKILFKLLAESYADKIDWSFLHLYWGDERCVPPDHSDSNFRMTEELLLSQVPIPAENIHRVRGEAEPALEAERYGQLLDTNLAKTDELPVFDLIILGMGADGHTASIFPHESHLLQAKDHCVVATHPASGQIRISLSGPVINAAKRVVFLITGASKRPVLAEVFAKTKMAESYPVSHIGATQIDWFLDQAAAP